MPTLVKRTQIVAWLDTTPKESTETWGLVGNKTNSLSYAYNPSVETEQSVVEDVANTDLNGYQIAIDGEMKCYFGDAVYDFINGLRYNLAIGDDAKTKVLLVDKYDFTGEGSEATFKAQVFECVVSVNTYGGEGGATPTLSYSIGISGNPTNGTVTISGGQPSFTAEV